MNLERFQINGVTVSRSEKNKTNAARIVLEQVTVVRLTECTNVLYKSLAHALAHFHCVHYECNCGYIYSRQFNSYYMKVY